MLIGMETEGKPVPSTELDVRLEQLYSLGERNPT